MNSTSTSSPEQQVPSLYEKTEEQARSLYEETESSVARALEELVAKPSFGVLLARSAENFVALVRIGSDMADLVLRNLRLAGRADITRLARQLQRTEDKLERVLQEVEGLRDELADERAQKPADERGAERPEGAAR
jgi:hypothetical protein